MDVRSKGEKNVGGFAKQILSKIQSLGFLLDI